jgi:diaminopimelate decarboxylase
MAPAAIDRGLNLISDLTDAPASALDADAGTSARPRHTAMTHWHVAGDCLHVGGIALPRLAQRVGATPFYAYDRALISERIDLLRRHLPRGVKLHYAMKANPMPAVVGHVGANVDGLDVASAGELAVALDAGVAPRDISFAGPGKTDGELRQAVAAGILVNVESLRELDVLERAAEATGSAARVALRVNPDFELKSSGMKMGGGARPFGVDAEAAPDALHEIGRRRHLAFEGFHIFAGSQNLKADAIVDSQQRSVELAARLAAAAPAPVRTLNIGGGFGIPYFPGERPLNLAQVGEGLARVQAYARATTPDAELIVELGRYIVGEAGIYVCRVIDRKVSRGETFLVTDGGLHHHLAASGNFGQVVRKNYPACIGNRVSGGERETASVVGPLCTPLDLLASRMDFATAQPGDFVVIFQSGAYGATASPQAFLSHPGCREVLV